MAPVDRTAIYKDMESFLKRAYTLSDEHLDALSAAVRLHQAACLLYVSDLNAAYALVVAGLERLSRTFGTVPTDWADWPDFKSWDDLFVDSMFTAEQAEAVRSKLLENAHLRLQRTFVNYILERVPLRFWKTKQPGYTYNINYATSRTEGGAWDLSEPLIRDKHVTRESLLKALKGSYQTRSNYVHAGIGKVNILSEMQNSYGQGKLERIPFAALRAALRYLILKEVKEHKGEGDMPDIWLGPEGATPPESVTRPRRAGHGTREESD
jgi:hypothetical protein